VREKLDCACDAFYSYFADVATVLVDIFWCISYVPAVHYVWIPCPAICRRFVDQYFGFWWCHECFIVTEGTIELRFGGQLRFDI